MQTELLPTRMESLRSICDREIQTQLQKMDLFSASFAKSLDSIKATVEETVQNQGKLGKLKSSLRDADDEFVKILAVKTRNEAKQMATRDSITATRARIQQLERTVQARRARREEYAHTLEETEHQDTECKREIQEAMSWYNRVLGFNIEGGRGVKFTFNNINLKNRYEEYSFTIRHEQDKYTLLACDPQLNDTKDLLHELNKTNSLFKFIRTMREKFQEAASLGSSPQSTTLHQESATISVSAPVLSASTDRSDAPERENKHPEDIKTISKKGSRGRGVKHATLSPASVRQSPRLQQRKK